MKGNKMRTWFRTRPMQISCKENYLESWYAEGAGQRYDVNVCLGKPVDILSLKSDVASNFESQVSFVKSTRSKLYSSGDVERVDRCPVCDSPSEDSKFLVSIYGARFHQCSNCTHCFVIKRLSKTALQKFYSSDVRYSCTYTSKEISDVRVEQVAMPKAKWMIKRFEALYGRKPESVLDVGAGAGHFVYACKQLGMRVQGVELSGSSIDFCKKNFGIDLQPLDFTSHWEAFSDVDIVTFWGVIEHVPNPVDFLKTARKIFSGRDGMIVAEVPRWDCVSTVVQKLFPDTIIRHLDPLGHINVFTDNSLCTAFDIAGFGPVAAWYFGMDAYELTTTISHLVKESRPMEVLGRFLPLQGAVDEGQLSDEIILAGRPVT